MPSFGRVRPPADLIPCGGIPSLWSGGASGGFDSLWGELYGMGLLICCFVWLWWANFGTTGQKPRRFHHAFPRKRSPKATLPPGRHKKRAQGSNQSQSIYTQKKLNQFGFPACRAGIPSTRQVEKSLWAFCIPPNGIYCNKEASAPWKTRYFCSVWGLYSSRVTLSVSVRPSRITWSCTVSPTE